MKMSWLDVEKHNAKVFAARHGKDAVAADAAAAGTESKLQADIASELRRRRWYFVQSRTDKSTRTQLGVPDFIVAVPSQPPVTIWMECKTKTGKLSQEQTITRHILEASYHHYFLVRSIREAVESFNLLKL